MKLRSFSFLPMAIPALAMGSSAIPPPEFVSNHPLVTNWFIGLLMAGIGASVLIHGFFLGRMIKQFEANNEQRRQESIELFEIYRGLEHRQTETETHMQHCCGIPGGKRWYDYEGKGGQG